jgi:two-component system, sensor histidine kinase and response regulator
MNPARPASIMVVDDQPANLKLLEGMLKQDGYAVRSFPRGRLALAAAEQTPPDLVLLDITMPEMTGYHVCQRLKSNPQLARIPVIFLSALNETDDKVTAFQAGGVDYVTKPFQVDEVRARVKTHLEIHRLRTALEEQAQQLEALVDQRTQELRDAHARLTVLDRSKSDFLRLISHELRSPLNGLLGIGELLLDDSAHTPQTVEFRQMFDESRRRLLTILEDASLLTQIEVESERFSATPISLATVLERVAAQTSPIAASRELGLTIEPAGSSIVLGELQLSANAISALVETAIRFCRPRETVRVSSSHAAGAIHVRIESGGGPLSDAVLARLFEIFAVGQAITREGDLGLRPAVAQRILALFGGSVAVENRSPQGVAMTARLLSAG